MNTTYQKVSETIKGTPHEIAESFFTPWKIRHTNKPYRVEGEIPVNLPLEDNANFLFISKDQRALTHGIHKYPAKFFPELPRWLIKRYSKPGETVLDPFMGSGTTNLEASLLGRDSIGIDVDAFSRYLAKVKTTVLPQEQLLDAWSSIQESIESYNERSTIRNIPDFPYRDNWFKPYVLKELAYLKNKIESLKSEQDVKNFFYICFSSVIRQASEADNNCTRTVIRKNLQKNVLPLFSFNLFRRRTEDQIQNMIELASLEPNGRVYIPENADARRMPSIPSNSIDFALTSPPYVNAVDYPRTHQLEIYWLGFANGSLRPLKEAHVGTEVVRARDYSTLHNTKSNQADITIGSIFEKDPRRAYIATKYIWDMTSNLKEVYRVLKPNSVYAIVVGNNMIRGIEFESWRYIRELAIGLGYKVEYHFISEIIRHFIKIPRSERINNDHILILRK